MAVKKRAAPKASKGPAPPEDRKLVYLQTRLSEKGWMALKMLSLKLRKPMQQLTLTALNDLLEKHGHERDVTGPAADAKEEK